MTIAECADQRSHQKLGQGIASGKQSQGATVRSKLREQKRKQRENDAFAQAIVQQCQEGAQKDWYPKALHGILLLGDTHAPTGP